MKKLAGLVLLLAAVNLCAAPGMKIKGAGVGRLKTLVGEWEGTTENGARVRASYKLASNGTAILETLQTAGESEMITVYYRDADHLMLTHYCSEGNQPRMRTTPPPAPPPPSPTPPTAPPPRRGRTWKAQSRSPRSSARCTNCGRSNRRAPGSTSG